MGTQQQLEILKQLAAQASGGKWLDQGKTSCCYTNSDKHWTIDPQGLAWEHFRTLSQLEEFGVDDTTQAGACCIPRLLQTS
ncbi:MAG: hypothetical protein ACN4GM_07380 [Gammaproteobacteria bacterium]